MKPVRPNLPPHTDGEFSDWTLEQLADWAEHLPRGSAEMYADALGRAIKAINCAPLRKARRFEVMELLRPAVNDAVAMLVSRHKNTLPLLPAAARAQAEAAQSLLRELASGFDLVADELLRPGARPAGRDTQTTLHLALQRSLLCLGRRLLEGYRIYAPEPPGLWQQIHTVYRNAELRGLQSLPIEAAPDAEETALSIKQAYLRIALLALSNPYHLLQGEAEELYRRIGRWAHLVTIHPVSSSDDLRGQFVVDLAGDFPPRYAASDLRFPPPRQARRLELEGIVDAIGRHIERCDENIARSAASVTLPLRLQRDFYLRLQNALGARQERRDARKPTMAKLALAEGLGACHFFLSGRRSFDPERGEQLWRERRLAAAGIAGAELAATPAARPRGAETRIAQFAAFDAEADDVWRKALSIERAQPRKRRPRGTFRATTWQRKNESRGGMALFCTRGEEVQARVGELLAYTACEDAQPADWRLGAIRWVRTRAHGGVEVGVKHLADSGYAVGIKAIAGAGRSAGYLRGILMPRTNPLTHPATLLTPAGVYNVGSVLALNFGDLILYARLIELLETSPLLAQFRLRIVEPPLSERYQDSAQVVAHQPAARPD